MSAITITSNDHDAAGFLGAAAASQDADAARRMLALALVLDGALRADAARACGMDWQTLRDWVHRYNDEGLAGLSDRRGAVDPRPRLSPEQAAVVAELVRAGPDPAVHGVVRWRRADLATVIEARFDLTLAERTVGTLLRRLGFCGRGIRRKMPQPNRHTKKLCRVGCGRRSPNAPATSRSSSGGRTRPASASRAP